MKKQDGFYFIPKKWLGDANVIAMDWDCKAMHLHLMAIAWQQEPKGYILEDDVLIRKLLGSPDIEDWEHRIKPQIFVAWKKKALKINDIERSYWYQPGIVKTFEESSETPKKRTRKKKEEVIIENPEFEGFNLKSVLDFQHTTTILHEEITKEERSNIWTLGIQALKTPSNSETEIRRFIGQNIKIYGEKQVAQAIANLSLKSLSPVDARSYLIGILKKQQIETIEGKKGSGRGRVSI